MEGEVIAGVERLSFERFGDLAAECNGKMYVLAMTAIPRKVRRARILLSHLRARGEEDDIA